MATPMPFVPDAEQVESARQLEAMVARPKRKKGKTVPPKRWEPALDRARERMKSGEWEGAKPLEFVALFFLLHVGVYRVEPGELTSRARLQMAGAASRLLRDEFGGDSSLLAEMIRWTWATERKTEAWRRQNGRQGRRIGAGFQFSRAAVTNWKIGVAREQGK